MRGRPRPSSWSSFFSSIVAIDFPLPQKTPRSDSGNLSRRPTNSAEAVPTKARLFESSRGPIPLAIYSISVLPDHDSVFNLPASCREARRPIMGAMDGLLPPRSAPGYLTCEPATLLLSFGGASKTSAPPSGGRWPPWPPSPPAETSTVDTCDAVRDHTAPHFAPLPPAANASFHCLVC